MRGLFADEAGKPLAPDTQEMEMKTQRPIRARGDKGSKWLSLIPAAAAANQLLGFAGAGNVTEPK